MLVKMYDLCYLLNILLQKDPKRSFNPNPLVQTD